MPRPVAVQPFHNGVHGTQREAEREVDRDVRGQ
jgi:hypothetical protein